MKIVIDIPDHIYRTLIETRKYGYYAFDAKKAIKNGTPLSKGHWERMSGFSYDLDDRFKCSKCGNIVHYENKSDLYTFNRWCGRCGSDNAEKEETDVKRMVSE